MQKSDIRYLWMNGGLVPFEDAKIHVTSTGAFNGANVFEGIAGYWNEEKEEMYCISLREHFTRFFESMKMMRFSIPYPLRDLESFIREVIIGNEFRQDIHMIMAAYVEGSGPTATEPTGLYINPRRKVRSEGTINGLHCCISSWVRTSDLAIPIRIKSGSNYQNGRLAGLQAQVDGYDAPILLNNRGEISEGTGATFFMVRKGEVVTPPVTSDILESITRTTLIQLFEEEMGLTVKEREIDRTEVYVAEEAFFCGTGFEVTPIVSVDRFPLGNGKVGPITDKIRSIYFDIVRGVSGKHTEWLTPIYRSATVLV
ncbi:MAG: branched-chain-amino-acid transaminase [Candidatus Tectomicrobia bacterium]|nr:branched-chain-amino-acid transaminase [Candidatus Tectomicrobia bacterium]